jgi:hypothetical protein
MQAMIDVVQYNTRRDLVKLNPGKTEIIRMAKKNNNESSEYTLALELFKLFNICFCGVLYFKAIQESWHYICVPYFH